MRGDIYGERKTGHPAQNVTCHAHKARTSRGGFLYERHCAFFCRESTRTGRAAWRCYLAGEWATGDKRIRRTGELEVAGQQIKIARAI